MDFEGLIYFDPSGMVTKIELFCPGLEYSPHTVVLNQAMDFFQACISFRYLLLKILLCNRRELDSLLLHSNYTDAHTQHNKMFD